MSVKPVLLGLYETYYLPLGKTLKPGLQGLLTGVLPGLEEGSEYYDRWAEYGKQQQQQKKNPWKVFRVLMWARGKSIKRNQFIT